MVHPDVAQPVQQNGPLRTRIALRVRLKAVDVSAWRHRLSQAGQEISEEHAGVDYLAITDVLPHELNGFQLPDFATQHLDRIRSVTTRHRNALQHESVFATRTVDRREAGAGRHFERGMTRSMGMIVEITWYGK